MPDNTPSPQNHGRIVPRIRSQIKFKRRSGGYRVFFPERLSTIDPESKEFAKKSQELQSLERENISIFGSDRDSLDEIVALLRTFGVNYQEKEARLRQTAPGDHIEVHEEYSCTIDNDIGRVLAKVAFNYFAYCASRENREDILFLPHFDSIRNFVHAGQGELRSFIPSIAEEPILYEERNANLRRIIHLINFLPDNGNLVARLTLFGREAVYMIILGPMPPELLSEDLGCGHAFDPLNHVVLNLTQNPETLANPRNEAAEYGLFRRNL